MSSAPLWVALLHAASRAGAEELPQPPAEQTPDAPPAAPPQGEAGESVQPTEPAKEPEEAKRAHETEPPSESEPLAVSEEPAASDAEPPTEVVVQGRIQQGGIDRAANAVTTVDLDRARRESADLGTVLARVEGVNVQRLGGLGSRARFSLAGFDETQVRFFVDGVPLEFAGYPFGLQNVPIQFVQRVEVHKGVLPVRLGADALGGAFELITDRATVGTRASASYEVGSFGTHRLSMGGRHRDEKTGFFVKAEAFLDSAKNDYPVVADVADPSGIISETKVYRLHDKYLAGGGNVEAGVVYKPWAQRLLFRAFATSYEKDIQHNAHMTVPYGEARTGGTTYGASVRYENTFDPDVRVSGVGGYVFEGSNFIDTAECSYNWFGQCQFPQRVPGEIGERPADLRLSDRSGYLRASGEWLLHPNHELRLTTAPTYFSRSGDNLLDPPPDPANDPREMFTWVNGVEYEANVFESSFQNVLFGKSYVQSVHGKDYVSDIEVNRDAERALWGGGDALRYSMLSWLFAKASYELAYRLPSPRELFGTGALIADNLTLEPERSHNANLSLVLDQLKSPVGTLHGHVTGFLRDANQLVVLLRFGEIFRYQNVVAATVRGVETALTWTSPGDYLELGGNATYQDIRNTATEGHFSGFNGDRLPNRPWFWINGQARLQKRGLAVPKDELSLTWYTRYVHEFCRNWESVSCSDNDASDDTIPSQLVHTAVLGYLIAQDDHELSFSLQIQNITDQRVYDSFGVQLPGRAFYGKIALTY